MIRVFLFIIMMVSIDILALSCRNNKQEKENYEFYYYPKRNVYYEVEKKRFFYSLDGGKTWDSTISSSDEEPATLGEKIIIYSADYNIHKDNPAHRKLYNGRLYNIVNSGVPLTTAEPEVTERKAVRKNSANEPDEVKPKPEEDKPKKGLKKFLDKIFGKHHKKTNPADTLDQ